MFLSEPYENADSLPEHIKNFCAGRVIVTRQVVVDLKQAAEIAVKQARGMRNKYKFVNFWMFFIEGVSVSLFAATFFSTMAPGRWRGTTLANRRGYCAAISI